MKKDIDKEKDNVISLEEYKKQQEKEKQRKFLIDKLKKDGFIENDEERDLESCEE